MIDLEELKSTSSSWSFSTLQKWIFVPVVKTRSSIKSWYTKFPVLEYKDIILGVPLMFHRAILFI